MNLNKVLIKFIYGIIFLNIISCSSTKTQYYILDSAKTSNINIYNSCKKIISLEKVDIAKYLDKPNIITRIKPNKLCKTEFHQWSEPLDDNILRILQQNLSKQLTTNTVVSYPLLGRLKVNYHVEIKVKQFDVDTFGRSILKVSWYIYDNNKKIKQLRNATYCVQSKNPSNYLSITRSMNKNIEQLSNDIGSSLNKFCQL
ncbi:PqiC family protein [Gammaproteobacteria bacterium]|nr:PqiC family protein [Gammaproteobacteria bacterium]